MIYTFQNKDTGEIFEEVMSLDDREIFLKQNPHVQQLIVKAPMTIDPYRLGRMRTDDNFNDLMKTIHKRSGSKSKINVR